MKSDFKNLVKPNNNNINPNFINNSYSNIQQNTDNSNINSVNYANLFNQKTNNNITITPDTSNINYNLFRNNNNDFENNSFENNNINNSSISNNNNINFNNHLRPNNVLIKTGNYNNNSNGIVVNAKTAIQNQSKELIFIEFY